MADDHKPLEGVRLLTVAEVVAMLRMSKMTVYRRIHAGELAAIRMGKIIRVREDAVHAYLKRSQHNGQP